MNFFATYFSMGKGMAGQTTSGWSRAHENGASSALLDASKGPVRSVFEALSTVPEGLTEAEVQERLETHGRNTVAHERAMAWPRMLLNNFRNPFILVLFVLGSVSYATGDLKEEIRAATGGKGADVVYDCVGDKYAEPAIRAMNWGGRYLVIGFAGGQIPKIPLNLLLLKSSSLVGVFWGAHVTRDPVANRVNLEQLIGWVSEGKLKPHIHKIFPLAQTADAIRELDRRASTGKVIIKP